MKLPPWFKRYFPLQQWLVAGLLVITPIGITFLVLQWIVSLLDETLLLLPESWRPQSWLGVHIPGFGIVLALGVLLLVGALTSNFIGRQLLSFSNGVLRRIPVVRSIYSGVKQVSDTVFSQNSNAFRKTVLIQWPRPGIWTLAFVTGTPNGNVHKTLGDGTFLSVYVPTTPNPTSGYLALVPYADCKELEMSVDDALKYIVSMGVVTPPLTSSESE